MYPSSDKKPEDRRCLRWPASLWETHSKTFANLDSLFDFGNFSVDACWIPSGWEDWEAHHKAVPARCCDTGAAATFSAFLIDKSSSMIFDGVWELDSLMQGCGYLNTPTKSVTDSVAFSCSLAVSQHNPDHMSWPVFVAVPYPMCKLWYSQMKSLIPKHFSNNYTQE